MSFTWRFRAFGPFKAPCVHLAVDRQMTPPSHAVLLGPSALSPRLASARLSGSASRPLRPKASRVVLDAGAAWGCALNAACCLHLFPLGHACRTA